MLRKVYHDIRRLGSQLRDRSAPPRRVIHKIPSEETFVRALSDDVCPRLSKAKSLFFAGNRVESAREIVQYFRKRDGGEFFISSSQISTAIEEIRREKPDWVSRVLQQADEMSCGNLDVYSQNTCLRSPEDWAFAPLGPGGDMLYRYRPHRFAFAPRLALASLHGHAEALGALKKFIFDWAASVDPDGRFEKKNRTFYTSSHVSLYRSIALSWVQVFLSAESRSDIALEMLILRIILGDALYIQDSIPNTTRNNHLLADGFGLWYLGSIYPEFIEAKDWVACGYPVFKRELLRQVYPDGSSFEQSVHYQEHASEMGLAYLLLSKRNGWIIDAELADRIEAMLFLQASLTGRDGVTPAIGDATEDPLFPLDGDGSWCGPAMRAMYMKIFDHTDLPIDSAAPSLERSFWLGGGSGIEPGAVPLCRSDRLQVFPTGGFAVFTAREGVDRLIFRTGPGEGTNVAPGHMHFDFLSIYLVVDGKSIFVPSGTYTYRSNPLCWPWKFRKWRTFFLSPCAANGLIKAGMDPLRRGGGDFPGGVYGEIPYRIRTSTPLSSESLAIVSARVVGTGEYAGWARCVIQIRDEYWLIVDRIPADITSTPAWIGLQCPEGAKLVNEGGHVTKIEVEGVRVDLSYCGAVEAPMCLEGSSHPRGGWVSSSYGRLVKAPKLLFRLKNGTDYCVFAFSGQPDTLSSRSILQMRTLEEGFEVVIAGSTFEDQLKMEFFNCDSTGFLTWQRRIDHKIVMEERLSGQPESGTLPH